PTHADYIHSRASGYFVSVTALFLFTKPPLTEFSPLPLHDALPISDSAAAIASEALAEPPLESTHTTTAPTRRSVASARACSTTVRSPHWSWRRSGRPIGGRSGARRLRPSTMSPSILNIPTIRPGLAGR